MNKNNLKIINEISKKLKIKYEDFKGMYFFGSRYRGDYDNYSDFDFLLVFDRTIDYQFKKEVYDILYDSMLDYDIVIDAKIFSENDIRQPKMPFTEEVKKSGYYHVI